MHLLYVGLLTDGMLSDTCLHLPLQHLPLIYITLAKYMWIGEVRITSAKQGTGKSHSLGILN